MCGGGTTTTQNGKTSSTTSVPGYIEDASKRNIALALEYLNKYTGDQPLETEAYGGIQQNSKIAEGYMPSQQDLITQLYAGGGLGEGAPYIRDAYGQVAPVYSNYLQEGYLDPMSNPYLQPSIESARSGAFNDVASRFNKAGRSFSGAEGAAYGDAAAKAAMPLLLGQYNQNVTAQQGAAQGLLSGALGASTGLTQAQQAVLQAKMAAPQQIANLNIPENMLLAIEDRKRAAARDAMMMQFAALTGTPYGTTTTGSSLATNNVQSDPFQAMLGGGLGLLGAFM